MVASRIPEHGGSFDRRNPNHPFLKNGGKDLRGGNVAPHQLVDHVNWEAFAAANDATIIPTTTQEAPVLKGRRNVRADVAMVLREIAFLGNLAKIVGKQAAQEIMSRLWHEYTNSAEVRELFEADTNGLEVSPYPGWCSFLKHMEGVLQNQNLRINGDSEFQNSHPHRDVRAVGEAQARKIISRGVPQILLGHSQGGSVAVQTAFNLEQANKGELVSTVLGLAPAYTGLPEGLDALIRVVAGRLWEELHDLRAGSEATRTVGQLSAEMRRRFVTVHHKSGDGLLPLSSAYVANSRMLAPNERFGHESAGRHSRNSATRVARAVLRVLGEAHEISRQPAYY